MEPQWTWLEEEGNWAGGNNDLQQRDEPMSSQPVSPGSFSLDLSQNESITFPCIRKKCQFAS